MSDPSGNFQRTRKLTYLCLYLFLNLCVCICAAWADTVACVFKGMCKPEDKHGCTDVSQALPILTLRQFPTDLELTK